MQLSQCYILSRPNTKSVFTACDSKYFNDFGMAFSRSVLSNTDFAIHFHIFNPTSAQLDYCKSSNRITVSYESVTIDQFRAAAQRWAAVPNDPVENSYRERTFNAMGKSDDKSIEERMQKTYFACVRFVRLCELYDPAYQMFSMDVDALVRTQLQPPGIDHALYLHRIHGRKARFLAGGIWLNANAQNTEFLKKYADAVIDHFHRDYIYWGIDQDVLETVLPIHNPGQLPKSYIDWDMNPSSAVWTAKGTRKSDPVFQSACQQFQTSIVVDTA